MPGEITMSIAIRDWSKLRAGNRPVVITALGLLFGALVYGCMPASTRPPAVDFDCPNAEECKVPVEVTCPQSSSPCTISVGNRQTIAAHGFAVVWDIVQKPGQSYAFKNP